MAVNWLPSVSTAKRKSRSPRTRRTVPEMAPTVESKFKDLLNPVKDPEKSFSVNIAELLFDFVEEFVDKQTFNFNSAALLLQGSASIYGKKVEYLHNLATQLHNTLLNQKKGDHHEAKKETKERMKKDEKLNDPFLSVDFKIGKNLSCLRKKNLSKTATKKSTKKVNTSIPVHLLSNDNEDKGEVFYDTREEIVGNKGDFAINKCRLINSGWLLLPTVNPNLVPSLAAVPDYYDDSDMNESCEISLDDIDMDDPVENNCISDDIQPSPDEGFENGPQSSNVPSSAATSDVNSEHNNTNSPLENINTAPPSTDEGISSTPNDDVMECNSPGTAEGNENIPAENGTRTNSNQAPQPVRHSVRQALQTCQLAVEDDPLAGVAIDKELLVRKKIQKKNVCCLPSKLKMGPNEEEVVPPISQYCARTFFAIEEKGLKRSLLNFDVIGFDQNSKFVDRILSRLAALKSASKSKLLDPIEDEQEINVEEVECLQEANEDEETLCAPFDDNDIQIDHDIVLPPMEPPPPPPQLPIEVENAEVPEVPAAGLETPEVSQTQIAHEEYEKHIQDLNEFVQNSDITKRVHEWEKRVKPFLDELDRRESFDINLYGSRILNAFKESDEKQTMTFRQFCKDKEKWEIHRYFMALLPLANVGNVAIESEPKEDGTEEIFVTLLSRKMHHIELEEFGQTGSSHS